MTDPLIYADMTDTEKSQIWAAVDALVANLAAVTGMCAEAVATSAYYRLQRHPAWGRNASKDHKQAAHAAGNGRCYKCGEEVALKDATFHHLRRGIPNQHGPANLVPSHEKCHNEEHGAEQASLMKGSPRRRKPTA
jgi:hypothetical protein